LSTFLFLFILFSFPLYFEMAHDVAISFYDHLSLVFAPPKKKIKKKILYTILSYFIDVHCLLVFFFFLILIDTKC
jgi:hypothetical protein